MVKEGKFLKIFLALLILIVIAHSLVYLGVFSASISGLSISEKKVEEDAPEKGPIKSLGSVVFLVLEWSLLIGGIIFAYAKQRVSLRKEYEELKSMKNKKYAGNVTDIDKLYEFLKEKKHLRISTISKVFDVGKEVVVGWAKTLESGNFATLTYPRIGGPGLALRNKHGKD